MTRKVSFQHKRLERLRSVLKGGRALLIILQDFPDPDAIASASALRELAAASGLTSSIACSGVVGRAENQALVRYLGINLQRVDRIRRDDFDRVAMVDTQPGTGNNAWDPEDCPNIVIDHHPIRKQTRRADFHDIRSQYGSTATMLYEYLAAAGLEISTSLATALAYGIRSDTSDLGRETTQADIDAFFALYPAVNKRKLSRIEMERLPRRYFDLLALGLKRAVMYGNCIVSDLGQTENPDMVGEVADLILRNEDSEWALCLGYYGDRLLMSIRTSLTGEDAGRVMHHVVGRSGTGGGHCMMAGGQVPLAGKTPAQVRKVEDQLVRRFLRFLKQDRQPAEKLVQGI